jgi:hypothetical protein
LWRNWRDPSEGFWGEFQAGAKGLCRLKMEYEELFAVDLDSHVMKIVVSSSG